MFSDVFKKDLAEAKAAEKIVLDTFSSLATGYTFTDVSADSSCYYRGDIKAVAADGTEIFIEVKNDNRIADTGRILCEEEVYYYENDYYSKGNMSCNSDYFCIVSQSERRIYVLDFKKLKEIYKRYGEYKIIKHAFQESYVYLLDLCWAKSKGALIHKITY